MKGRIELDIDRDLDDLLDPKPDEDRHHQQWWSEADLRVVARALRGDPPRDDAEREARRTLLNGIVFTLSGEQEVDA